MSKQKTGIVSERLRREATTRQLFEQAKDYAVEYMQNVSTQLVFPEEAVVDGLEIFREPLPLEAADSYQIIEQLHHYGSSATVAQTGGRYFGFVNGGIIPASLAVKWLVDTWDQNAALYVMSPISSVLEEVCEGWLRELFGFPTGTAVGFVGGSSAATLCGLTAGRNRLLEQSGYDVNKQGLFGAPEIKIILGEGAHSSVYKALSILGLGSERVIRVPMDDQGRIITAQVPELDDKTLLILQAGNVNTGSFDDFQNLCERASRAGSWVHVDGAFGLWAAASDEFRHLTQGIEQADSWSLDAHKTLNAPYDNGIIICADREALTKALHMTGSYIVYSDNRDGMLYTPDMSRRARAVELWAALKSLGRRGVAELVEDLHEKAAYFAAKLEQNNFLIHNQVVFNQIITSDPNPEMTRKILNGIQASGECWCGGALWNNTPVIRVSVCSYRTTYQDIDLSVNTFIRAREEALKADRN